MNHSSVRISFLALTLAASLSAQSEPAAPAAPTAPAPAAPSADSAAPSAAAPNGNGDRPGRNRQGNFNPADLQARLLQGIRDQMGVKDDAEWTLISERITAIVELRRNGAPNLGFAFGRGGGRNGITANPEQDALRQALTDNLPDSEITARLAKLRESRKQNDAKLDQAREALRAVLTPRQEAVAVMTGLLN